MRKFPAFVELRSDRRNFILCEISGSVTDHFVFIGKGKNSQVAHFLSSGSPLGK
jgi:hypothetical protein